MGNLIYIIKTHKKKFYIIGAILILIIVFLLVNFFKNKSNVNKTISNKDYVFTQVEKSATQKLPYINVDGEQIEKINDKLYEDFYMTTSDEKNKYDYKYYLDDNLLYIFIEIEEYKNNIKNPRYISYYIDIDKGTLYSLADVLEIHDMDMNRLTTIINNELNSSYVEETELGYVEEGFCDFECYKDIHDINPLNKRIALFYDGNKLTAYLNYTVETIYYVDTNPTIFPHIFEL